MEALTCQTLILVNPPSTPASHPCLEPIVYATAFPSDLACLTLPVPLVRCSPVNIKQINHVPLVAGPAWGSAGEAFVTKMSQGAFEGVVCFIAVLCLRVILLPPPVKTL